MAIDGDRSAEDKGIYAIPFCFQGIFFLYSLVEFPQVEPSILVDPDTLILFVGRENLLQFVDAIRLVQGDLVVARGHVLFVRENPDLKKFHRTILIFIVFAVIDPGACTHYLHIPVPDNRDIAHAVLVFEISFQRNGDDLHVVVGMRSEAHSTCYSVVIQNTQSAKLNPLRIVIIGKTKGMPAVEPSVVGISPGLSFMKNCIFHLICFMLRYTNIGRERVTVENV